MLGYYKNEEKTREVLTEDGWFKTGDIGKIEQDHLVFIREKKNTRKLKA